MVEENDIRTGNLVWYYNLYMVETTFQVEGVLEGYIYSSSLPKSRLPLDKVHPVALETDHLRSFGFIQGESAYGEDENVFSYKYSHKDCLYIRDEGYSFQLLAGAPGALAPCGCTCTSCRTCFTSLPGRSFFR